MQRVISSSGIQDEGLSIEASIDASIPASLLFLPASAIGRKRWRWGQNILLGPGRASDEETSDRKKKDGSVLLFHWELSFVVCIIFRHSYRMPEDLLKLAFSFEKRAIKVKVASTFGEACPKDSRGTKFQASQKLRFRKLPIKEFPDGIVINGEFGSPEVERLLAFYEHKLPLIVADPPYGEIVENSWDKGIKASNYMAWTKDCLTYLSKGASLYMWGGIGKPGNRIFFEWLSTVEKETGMTLRNLITWKKRRAYGKKDDYLFTREECAWLINGEKPKIFNIPLLDIERGYMGFNKDYPAKSKYLRRSNVWADISELFVGKVHIAQKPERLAEIMIETHTRKGDTVMDPFAGSGSTGLAARKLGRRFILIERDPGNFQLIVDRLSGKPRIKEASNNFWRWEIETIS